MQMSGLGRTSRRRPSYANVTATLALVVALCGGAYAAGLGRNDVKSKNIAPKAVKTSDLATKAVKTPKIADDAVTGAQVAEASLGTVPDADKLDGLDSLALLKGSGRTYAVPGVDPEGGSPSPPVSLDIGGTFTLECRNPASVGSEFKFTNTGANPVDVWVDRFQDGVPPPVYVSHTSVPSGGTSTLNVSGPIVSSGLSLDRFTIAAGARITLIEARLFHSAAVCRFPLLITELSG